MGKFVGFFDDDRQYSREDLRLAANAAVKLNRDIINFLDGVEFQEAVARQGPLNCIDTDSILGISKTAEPTTD